MTKRTVLAPPAAVAAVILLGACGAGAETTATTTAATTTGMSSAATSTTSPTSAAPASATASTSSAAPAATSGTAGIAVGDQADAQRWRNIAFAQLMTRHHEQALVLADLALTGHGASPQVQALAKRIKAAQAPQIEQMRGWLTEWNAPLEGPEMPMPGMVGDTDLAALGAAKGAAFDRLWLTHMIEHHEGAVIMAQDGEESADARIKKLATSIIAGQRRDLTEMKALLG